MAPQGHPSPRAAAPREGRPSDTLRALLVARAQSDAEAPAILSPGREELSVGALVDQIDRIRAHLNSHGIGRGDRVAVLAWLGPEAAVAVLGAASASACIPINPLATAELEAALDQTRAGALLAPNGADATVREAAARRGLALFEGKLAAGGEAGRFELSGGRAETAARPGPAGADDVALVLRTSGTTSNPKLVPSTHRQLLARADRARRLFGLGEDDRNLCPMPLCYAHGLYTGLATSLAAGGSVILAPRFDEETFLSCLCRLSPTWCSAGATHHTAILGWLRRRGAEVPRDRLRFLRSGAAALPRPTLDGLEALLGVPVVEAYSTSETGIITANPPHGARKTGSVGRRIDGEVTVLDERGSPVPSGTPGEIFVRGPGVCSGYEGDAELNDRSFVDGWFRTGDRGVVDADGYLTIAGRIDDVINRGGEKVSPAEVERALEEHPEVHEAVVFPLPHPTLGADVGAAVRLGTGSASDEAALRRFVAERLLPFKVPRRVVTVPELPTGPSGKPVRAGMAERLGLLAAEASVPAGDRTPGPLKAVLSDLWGQALGRHDVGADDDFFGLGGDSLSALELIAGIEAELDVGLELEDLLEAPTPRRLADTMFHGAYLDRHRPSSGNRDVLGANTGGDRPPLFAVAGRPGYALRPLLVGRELDPAQPVYGLQPPGMDWSAEGIRTVPEMAAHYVGLVRARQRRGPYRLLGVSFGGLMVYEMARQLERAGEEVEFLGVVDTEPPTCRWNGKLDRQPASVDYAEEEKEVTSTGAATGLIVATGTRVSAAHRDARQAYVIEDRIRSDLTYFLCTAEGVVAKRDRRRLWGQATAGRLRLLPLPGFHARLVEEPQFSALRDALRACLSAEPPKGLDPAEVFDPSFSLEGGPGGEVIRDRTGRSFTVEAKAMDGRVRVRQSAPGRVLLRGWASDAGHRAAGGTVVAFVDGRFAAYSACGAPSENLERRHSAPGLRYAAFRMRVELPDGEHEMPRPRVFALSGDGRASELRLAG